MDQAILNAVAYKKLCNIAAAMLNYETGLQTGKETLDRIQEILAEPLEPKPLEEQNA